jgi:hypothetical protein
MCGQGKQSVRRHARISPSRSRRVARGDRKSLIEGESVDALR